ncbi:MAG: TetR family transcriptional regulator C-terminal domain-containing protein [Geminicoccaceae bacterium]|nr:TetR family transcriptional regulator C-terminal domain-containing protein [Geminicoccaceae bacterium]
MSKKTPFRRSASGSRIQEANRERILSAALEVFAKHGFRGATLDMIAGRAGMSKPNLLYYFRSKSQIYAAVLENTLDEWLEPLRGMTADGEPLDEIEAYLDRKLELARDRPEASRLFATEIIQGAPHIKGVLEGHLRDLVAEKCSLIQEWINAGRLAPVEPLHLIFMIWAMTQHYADFDTQIKAVSGTGLNDGTFTADARAAIRQLLFEGLRPRSRNQADRA